MTVTGRKLSRIQSNWYCHMFKITIQTKLANRKQSVIRISLDDLWDFNEDLTIAIELNTVRFQKLFAEVIDDLILDYREGEVRSQLVL